ncbi:30S ribosomal protein S5 [Halorutilales archaeon Cl-col2-1]|nr:30S ribosomal protein S5 [Halobacteria archaeon]
MSSAEYEDEWIPKTRLGRKVQEGEITSMDAAINSGLPLKEPEIVDTLLPDLDDEVLDINMVQRMTDSGRRVKFRCVVAVGNHDGYIGFAEAKAEQVGAGIRKAIDVAKLNMFKVSRGCGSWECGCGRPHTVALKTSGKSGSVEVELLPAPQGLGLAAGETATSVLELAGIEDIWTKSNGQTRTTVNFAKATYNALLETAEARVPPHAREAREVIE